VRAREKGGCGPFWVCWCCWPSPDPEPGDASPLIGNREVLMTCGLPGLLEGGGGGGESKNERGREEVEGGLGVV
jgi:hypothetical protein